MVATRANDTLAEGGEFELIAAMTARLPSGPAVELGPGDDAAVVAAPDGRVVATTDVLVEGVHFRRDWSTAYDVGRKAAAQNLADVAAMGARPQALLAGFAAPSSLPVAWALEFADGLGQECELAGASVAGGDIVSAPQVVISITALGSLEGRTPLTRAGARPGEVVAVCGRLGWSAAGLAVLSRDSAARDSAARDGAVGAGFESAREDGGDRDRPGGNDGREPGPSPECSAVVEAHRRPEPPYDAGPEAAALGATSLIDVSDGLLADLAHIARASAVRVDLTTAGLEIAEPVRAAGAELGIDPLTFVLAGGEDHALAGTFPAGTALPSRWRVIGRVLGQGRQEDQEQAIRRPQGQPVQPGEASGSVSAPTTAGVPAGFTDAEPVTLDGDSPTQYRMAGHEHHR